MSDQNDKREVDDSFVLEPFHDDDEFEDDIECGIEEYCFECNNLGTIPCECGGDLCVCENNGEMPCPYCGK